MSRYGTSKIDRDASFSTYVEKEPSWLADYDKMLSNNKTAVRSKEDDHSLFRQINEILNNGGGSKFSSVQEMVEDLKQRTGLLEFQKQAQETQKDLFQEIPALKHFIDNFVDSHPGTSVDAVIFNALKNPNIKTKLPLGDDVPLSVKEYINKKISEHNQENNNAEDIHLGKVDVQTDSNIISDNNPFNSLIPKGM